ncbi:hypothetical protein [Enterovirga sp. CN4-39]|uniref:hypothetical protein n=1 Tax=Enterovirga sp. CN4-39 TaxID=3400910 RepID=UPI003C0C1AB4
MGQTFDDLRFARGYIVSPRGTRSDVPPTWPEHEFYEFSVRHDVRLPVTRSDSDGASIICLGLLVDTDNPDATAHDFLSEMTDVLRSSRDAFFAAQARSCGRYVMLCRDGAGTFLLTDATGMKTAFYSPEQRVVGSHLRLLARSAGIPRAPVLAFRGGFPGIRTPLMGVFALTPNTALALKDFSVFRFYPKEPVATRTVEEAAEIIGSAMKNTVKHLARFFRPVVSVTAGIDSRVTLAATRQHAAAIPYFTYYRNDDADDDRHDRDFGEAIADRFCLDYRVLFADSGKVPAAYSAILDESTYRRHVHGASYEYYQVFGKEFDTVHIRSNLSEVGRRFYHNLGIEVREASDLGRVWLGKTGTHEQAYVTTILGLFEEFAATTDLMNAPIDPLVLLYWEHRMATWHAQVVTESDPAFETISLYNCRVVLEALLSVGVPEQKSTAIHRQIITSLWPDLTEYPVNGRPFRPVRTRPALTK